MKLISIFFNKKTQIVAAFTLMAIVAKADISSTAGVRRVFWNKFEAVVNDKNEVVLTWNVTEYNNKSFRVQHSVDGVKWEDIALVQSKNSAESMTDYTYTHNNPLKGKQFYRLQDIDVDLSSSGFSPVKALVLSNDKQAVSIWPNPATNEISLAGHDSDNSSYSRAQIFDLSGRMLIERQFGENSNTINIKDLQPGTYVVRIQNENGKIHNEKFVKQ
jgi:hypothetical protein